ncbi:MAG TPA: autotransporter domain-containing protein [Smithellaceae bacterium]|nr:autotransporter domain-containing protein [Smithellaceae bacterium]
MKKSSPYIFCLCFLICFPWRAAAQTLSPNYAESLSLAISHAVSPAGWRPSSLYTISPTAPAAQGLTYDNGDPVTGNLITRTAGKSRNFKWNYVGQAGYTIYGQPTTDAAWVTTGLDATGFLINNGVNGDNVITLIERGLGMDNTATHDAIIEYAVNPQYIIRPTRNPDISQYLPASYGQNLPFVKPAGMSDAAFNNFKAYYENWLVGAYGSYAFPWTQLGYTFFWGNGYTLAQINGMSEFIVLGGSPVDIYSIYATRSYIYTRNDGNDFSNAASSSYGNGFAGFRIDGTCDTVWAGHRFQKNVRHNPATPNQIIIESTGSVSDGQGLLVWSLNYDVTNNGIISGATTDKFGIAGTANIALLFKGDTSADYGTPVATGVNLLSNSGTISSSGIAVKSEAGNTIITNNAGGLIAGGVAAIQTGSGNDTVAVNGGEIRGRVDLGAGTDSFTVTAGSNARLAFTLNKDTAASAAIANTETVTIADNTTLAVTVGGTKNLISNDQFLIVDTGALTVTPANLTIQNDSAAPMLSFSFLKDSNKLYLIAARNGSYYGAHAGNASLGNVLDNLADTATGDMSAVLAALDRSGSAQNARQLEPVVNAAVLQAGYETAQQVYQTIIARIEERPALLVAGKDMMFSRPAAAEKNKSGAWAQVFGALLHQGQRDSVSGYDAQMGGITAGLDRRLYNRVLAGASFGYAQNWIKSSSAGTETIADSYQGNLYGSLAINDYYLNTIFSFGYNLYDSSRHISFGGIDRQAKSSYSGNQYSGYLEGGRKFNFAGLDITPLFSLQYLQLQLNGYSESGAGAVNLTVDAQRYNLMQSGVGFKIAYPRQNDFTKIIPELHARWFYDFIGDPQQTSSQFAGGGASFATRGFDPPRASYNIGAKLNIITTAGIEVSLNYDLELKQDFHSHNAYVNLHYTF